MIMQSSLKYGYMPLNIITRADSGFNPACQRSCTVLTSEKLYICISFPIDTEAAVVTLEQTNIITVITINRQYNVS